MRKLLPILILTALFVSCAQEVIEPEQQISGLFALDDGSCMVSEYLSFENGRLSQYTTGQLYPFAEGKIWHTDGKVFRLANKQNYSIREGVLTTSGDVSGPAELKDGVLTIGSKRYVALEGFEETPYSRIVADNEVIFPYTEQDISIPFTVENPLPGKELKVSFFSPYSGGSWVSNLSVQEGKITAHLSSTAEDRTGIIELSYTHAESVTVQIKQQPSTFITIPETSRTVGYTSSTQTLNYSIENPVATSSLRAYPSDSWVRNINISENQISFDVQENNTGADRSATLTLRYEGARDVTFTVLQRWSASSITLTPSSKEADYTGGSFTFNYAIVNPREGISVTATSQFNWITNVSVSGSTISYKVAENNSGSQRTGKIKLTYGSYASAEFTVTQSWTASSITMTPSSQTTDYTGGSFNFNYSITNPRTNTTVTAASQVSWINNVTVSGNSISYKVAENNSGTQRTGKIKLSYGSYATVEFIVTQTCTASSITMTPSSQTIYYTGGSFYFDYIISNPREGVSVAASSQNDWITNVSVTGTSVYFKVASLNSYYPRNGTIKLIYGSYATAEYAVMQSGKPVVSLTLNKSELTLFAAGASETLIATVDPTDASLQWSSNKTSVATVDQNGKVTAIGNGVATIFVTAGDKMASCIVTVAIPQPATVDLGLPSGLKWASCNLGASKPEECGNYYAWGEVETKDNYGWSTYKFGTSSSGPFSKYNTKSSYGTVDNKTVLASEDDAAYVKFGGKWRMPTDAEWTELRNKCTWTWTDNYNGTGVKGRIVAASNGNSIFLPAAGARDANLYNVGAYGNYWSSSLYTDLPYRAYYIYFGSGGVAEGRYNRCIGLSIRPVTE